MLRVDSDQPSLVWQSKKVSEMDTDGLHSVMATPLLEDGYIYSPCSYGQFRCVKADTGERIWETFAPTDRQIHALGQCVHREASPIAGLLPVQRNGRPDYREADAGEIPGDQSRAPARSHQSRSGPARGLVASGLCEQVGLRTERQGDRVRITSGGESAIESFAARAGLTQTQPHRHGKPESLERPLTNEFI